jgi:hypothetical protein
METPEPQFVPRIQDELRRLMNGSQIEASLVKKGSLYFVLYRGILTAGKEGVLPVQTDVLVPVPPGYPTGMIDMPALPADSPLTAHVVGGNNPQATIEVEGVIWKVLSYHPYTNGGGPPWNAMKHGFHDYYNHLYVWLHRLI